MKKRPLKVGITDLATTHPEMANEWHTTLNGLLLPTQVTSGSDKKVWWNGACGHVYDAPISKRSKGGNCPYCAGMRVLVGFNDAQTLHPMLQNEWHPTKNLHKTLKDFVIGSNHLAWWQCYKNHEWQCRISTRTAGKNSGSCPECNSLAIDNPLLASEWHPTKNGSLQPNQVSRAFSKHVWWLGSCQHDWKATVIQRNHKEKGSSCPYCSGRRAWKGYNDLATTHPHLIEEWHPTKNSKTYYEVSAGSAYKATWLCKQNQHEWVLDVGNRSRGTACPHCFPVTSAKEREILEHLKDCYPSIQGSVSLPIKWGRSNYSSVDMLIPDLNVIIEYDGTFWHKDRKESDLLKTRALLLAGYRVIRIRGRNLGNLDVIHNNLIQIKDNGSKLTPTATLYDELSKVLLMFE